MSRKKKKADLSFDILYDTMDDNFAFIAGHTSWGFPYGTTWEEIGIDPTLAFEEKVNLYEAGEHTTPAPAFPELTESRMAELRRIMNTLDDVHTTLSAIGTESGNDDLLDAADWIENAMDNIGVWVEIGSESKDNRTDSVQKEADTDDLPF